MPNPGGEQVIDEKALKADLGLSGLRRRSNSCSKELHQGSRKNRAVSWRPGPV